LAYGRRFHSLLREQGLVDVHVEAHIQLPTHGLRPRPQATALRREPAIERWRHRPARDGEPWAAVSATISLGQDAEDLAELTAREGEVLALIAQGLSDRGIGKTLWLTPKTVEMHIRHILSKLSLPHDGQHNRRVLAALVYLRGQERRESLASGGDKREDCL
jgi:DNA-binding CsgD family transcriptional regulator